MAIAQRYWQAQFLIPASTAVANAIELPLDFGDNRLDRVDIRIPPGPSGLVGLQVVSNGTTIIPWGDQTQWLYGDDEAFSIPVGVEIDQAFGLLGYNLDTFDHTIAFRFLVTPMALVVPTLSTVASSLDLVGQTGTVSASGAVSVAGVTNVETSSPSTTAPDTVSDTGVVGEIVLESGG